MMTARKMTLALMISTFMLFGGLVTQSRAIDPMTLMNPVSLITSAMPYVLPVTESSDITPDASEICAYLEEIEGNLALAAEYFEGGFLGIRLSSTGLRERWMGRGALMQALDDLEKVLLMGALLGGKNKILLAEIAEDDWDGLSTLLPEDIMGGFQDFLLMELGASGLGGIDGIPR